ncbi:hypothetical protein IM40_02770 [Candidatus Paracaedimonas acanthamoebae]|nr:hypothetical protein IM40_02770 [Candidatus Paracaedimonas acanthamoebae]
MLKMFKYELVILALAFCALQYGRLQNDTYASRSFLQSDRGNEETPGSNEWVEGSEIKASADETNITAMEQFLGVSAKTNVSINGWHSVGAPLKEHQVEI